MGITVIKAGVVDDVAPVGSPASEFTFPYWSHGVESNRLLVQPTVLTAGGAPVAGATLTVALWVLVGAMWRLVGTATALASGSQAAFDFGVSGAVVTAYLQLTSITGAGAASVTVTGTPENATSFPRSVTGVQLVQGAGVQTSAESVSVTLASDQTPLPVSVTGGVDRTATGAITAAQTVEINSQGTGTTGIEISGTWTGTVVFESMVSTVWVATEAIPAGGGTPVTSATANGSWTLGSGGFAKVRVRGATVATGSASVALDASTNTSVVSVEASALPVGASTSANQALVQAAPGAALPANVVALGGVGKDVAPAAVTDATTVRAWLSRVGEWMTRPVGPDHNDLFPAAAAPSDAVTNAENTPSIRSRLIGFNGATWDRIRTGQLGKILSATGVTGFLNTLSTGRYNATPLALADGDHATTQLDSAGQLKAAPSGPAGAALFTDAASIADNAAGGSVTKISALISTLNSNGNWERARSAITAASTTVTGFINAIPAGRFNASPATLTEGQFAPVQLSSKGSVKVYDEQASPNGVLADAAANPTTSTYASATTAFNGTTWDRVRSGIVAASTTVTGFLNVIPGIIYNASPAVRTEAQVGPAQGDLYGNQKVAEAYSPNYEDNTNSAAATVLRYLANGAYSPGLLTSDYGATVTKNAKAAAGLVTQVIAENNDPQPRYLQLHNTATTPAGGAVPAISVKVMSGETRAVGAEVLSLNGFKFATGVAYAWSTTPGTYTAATAANQNVQVFGV